MATEKKWVGLDEAILVAIRQLYEDAERLALILTSPGWREDIRAEEVYNYTRLLLGRELLPQAVIVAKASPKAPMREGRSLG